MELLGRTQTTRSCEPRAPADLPGHQQIPPSPEQSGSNGAAAKIGPKTWKRDYSLPLLLSCGNGMLVGRATNDITPESGHRSPRFRLRYTGSVTRDGAPTPGREPPQA